MKYMGITSMMEDKMKSKKPPGVVPDGVSGNMEPGGMKRGAPKKDGTIQISKEDIESGKPVDRLMLKKTATPLPSKATIETMKTSKKDGTVTKGESKTFDLKPSTEEEFFSGKKTKASKVFTK